MENNKSQENKEENSNHEEEEEQSNMKKEDNKSHATENEISNIDKDEESNQNDIRKESNKQIPKPKLKGKISNQKKKNIVKQKKESYVNPFLPENDPENKKNKFIKMRGKNNSFIKDTYLMNYNNDISDLNSQNPNKSVFSKISEIMYQKTKEEAIPRKKERDLEKEGEENYDKFTGEAYLCFLANKSNKENQKIINEFLERKKKEEMIDKVGIESDSERENELEPFQDSHRISIITDRNINFKSKRTVKQFLEDQKNKEENQKTLLKAKEKIINDKINSDILDKPKLNQETIKIANKGNRDNNKDIHQRLYEDFIKTKEKNEKNEKEKSHFNKNEKNKLPKSVIQKNVERLFGDYETRKKLRNEIIQKKEKEIKIRSSSHSSSKVSDKIIFKRFKILLETSIKEVVNKKLDENFEISFSDFMKILYRINFITKNYSELDEQAKDSKEGEVEIQPDIKKIPNSEKSKKVYKENKYQFDSEYKLLMDAWKIITKNKIFKDDILGPSQRVILFCLSVLGLYEGDINFHFIQKEFPFILTDLNDVNKYSNLSKQIYRYFNLYKSNAINGLLFREKNIQKILELEKDSEKILTFNPMLEKSSKKYILNSNSQNKMRLSVEKNYQQYQKNKELKLKEKEKLLENEEKEKCTFAPSKSKNSKKHDVSAISRRLYTTGLKHLKINNSTTIFQSKDNIYNSFTENINKENNDYRKMFNKNPLESDMKVKKKILEMKESRNKKAYEKLILKKGYIPKKERGENILFLETEYNNDRFVLEDEVSNTYKNTLDRYEKFDKRKSNKHRVKYEFEIYVDRKPRKLIIYKGDDINCKVKEFCNTYKLGFDERRKILQAINL